MELDDGESLFTLMLPMLLLLLLWMWLLLLWLYLSDRSRTIVGMITDDFEESSYGDETVEGKI